MKNLHVAMLAALLTSAALAGCASAGNGGAAIDENATYDAAVADQARQVSSSLSQAGVSATGTASISVLNTVEDDSAGALDKADFGLSVTDGAGNQTQAILRSMVPAAAVGSAADFMGGVALNTEINGDTGLGISAFPKTKAYLAFTGLARLRMGNASVDGSHFVVAWVSRGIRNDADNTLAASVDPKDLELHVVLPGRLVNDAFAIPGVADGFLYYYFENVRLKQLSPDEKAKVGEKLSPPEVPNQPPVALARILVDGKPVNVAKLQNTGGAVLNVILDGTLSSDADGTIQSYAWEVRQYNSTGGLESFNKTKGANVTVAITQAGLKQISLRIIDDKGGIANDTEILYVDYSFKTTGSFGPYGPAGAGTECQQTVNCVVHSVTLAYGANKLLIKQPTKTSAATTQCDTPTIQVKFGEQEIGKTTSADLTIADAAKLKVGVYAVNVFWRSQVQCVYELTAEAFYSPPAAT